MGGCLRAIGCLTVLFVLGIIAFLTRDRWLPMLPGGRSDTVYVAAGSETWQPLTPEGARRAQAALDRLRSPRGPTSATVSPGDLAAYIVQELSKTLPSSADSVQAAAIGDRLLVRAVVRTAELGDPRALGPLAMLFGERERVQLGGTLRIIRPGQAELAVKEFRIRDFNVPPALIPRLVRQMSRGERPPELAPDGLLLRTPEYVTDVRVEKGRITMFRAR